MPTEYRADLVVLLQNGEPLFGIIVEAQLSTDETKKDSWPLYATALRARMSCPTCVLVVSSRMSVARWAAEPIELGQPGCVFTPLVVGPDWIPAVLDVETAREAP